MTRRRSECYRNLDDPLKIFSLLTVKSCGVVLLFYAGTVATELVFGLWSLLFHGWSFLAQLGAAAILAIALVCAERYEDEHYLPAAIRYLVSQRWRTLYSGGCADDYRSNPLERIVQGGPWRP